MPTESLLLTQAQLELKFQSRDSLYFGKYLYQARFRLTEASCLRITDHSAIDQTLGYQQRYRQLHVITEIHENLHTVCDQFLGLANDYKKIIYGNWIYFYTNKISDIISLAQGPMHLNPQISQAEITHDKNTIPLLNPQHQFRTYFRSRQVKEQQFKALREFLDSNREYVKSSSGLKSFFRKYQADSSRWTMWTMDYYYVDHSDMKFVTALSLITPGLVSKTKQIVMVNKT